MPSAVAARRSPPIGVLNVGSEDQKGHESVRGAHRLLRDGGLPLNYHGFVEGDDIAKGEVDVIVTDGFTGNAVLKTGEGLAKFFSQVLRESLTSGPAAHGRRHAGPGRPSQRCGRGSPRRAAARCWASRAWW